MAIQFAEHCAWRAVYIRVGTRQVFHLGIDPTASVPAIFGGIDVGRRDCTGGRKAALLTWRIPLPLVRWRYPMGHVRLAVYKLQQRILHAIDGRFSGVR